MKKNDFVYFSQINDVFTLLVNFWFARIQANDEAGKKNNGKLCTTCACCKKRSVVLQLIAKRARVSFVINLYFFTRGYNESII